MPFTLELPLGGASGPVIRDHDGAPVVSVAKYGVWWPLGGLADSGQENALFMLGVLNGEAPDLPVGATPGPWWIEPARGARPDTGEPHFLIFASSPTGQTALACVQGGLVLDEQVVDAANCYAAADPCF